MTPVEAADNLREAVHRRVPNTVVGRPLKAALESEIRKLEVQVTLDEESLCHIGRLVQHAVGLFGEWTGFSDGADEIVGRVLSAAGCER